MNIVFATSNKGKVLEANKRLEKFGIHVEHCPFDLPELQTDDVRAIAIDKVTHAFEKLKKPVFAIDAGFFIHALNGFPRAYVRWVNDMIGVEGYLKLVEGKERSCEFLNVLAYMDENRVHPMTFEERVQGTLATESKGVLSERFWSILWHIFIPDEKSVTLAELSEEEFDLWRGEKESSSAFDQLGRFLSN